MTTHKDNLSELSLAQLETITGCAFKTIKRRLGALPPVRTDGKTLYFNPHMALPMIYEVGADKERGVKPLDNERARLAKSQADRSEIEVARMRAELVPAVEIEKAWNDLATAFRAKILSLPTKLAPKLAGRNAIAEIQGVLCDALEEALAELSTYEPKSDAPPGPEEGRGEGGAPAAADDQPVGGQREGAE